MHCVYRSNQILYIPSPLYSATHSNTDDTCTELAPKLTNIEGLFEETLAFGSESSDEGDEEDSVLREDFLEVEKDRLRQNSL
jgi:hypothetical protein